MTDPVQGVDAIPDAPISGTVLSANGDAVDGATIEALTSEGVVANVLTSATGAYRIDVPPGDYTLRVTPQQGDLNGLSTGHVPAQR